MGWLVIVLTSFLFICAMAIDDIRKPSTLGTEIRKGMRSVAMGAVVMGLVSLGAYLAIAGLLDRGETRAADEIEFATGMTQALERVAYLQGGTRKPMQEWSGRDRDGSRYALLQDGVGPFVRAENLSARACAAALNYLSPYATSVLVVRDERGLARLDAKARRCPEGDGRLQAVFRAPGTEVIGFHPTGR